MAPHLLNNAHCSQRVDGFTEGANIAGERGLWVSHPDLDLARSDGGVSSASDALVVGCRMGLAFVSGVCRSRGALKAAG